ncbi:MAG: sigma-70 family RNA polymerase sigma factor [Clostridia bacterium]|nr:sigma-70 family RNA polymerase sigma factor [Clostridia bacterium]
MDNRLTHELIKTKMTAIYRSLLKLGAAPADAEDIVQDTFYKALLYIDSVAPEKFSAWLIRVALNRYYDLCRKRQRHVEVPLDEVIVEEKGGPEERALDQERREEVEGVLAELPDMYKQLLILKYQLDLSYKEIAALIPMGFCRLLTPA